MGRAWSSTNLPIDALPKADLHAHLNGSLPLSWLSSEAARQCCCCPKPFSSNTVQWKDLDDFRSAYDARAGIIKATDTSSIPDQVLAIAKDCVAARVYAIELSITPY